MVRPDLQARGYRVFEVSAVAHIGLKELSFALADLVGRARAAKPKEEATRIVIRPKAVDDTGFTVTREEVGGELLFRVRGEKPERWVRQTDFNNDEAVGYLADRLNRLGVEDELMKAGARAGDGVAIGPEDNAVVFDWEPTVTAGAEMLGRRGEDHRFEAPRPAAQRRRDKQAERDEAAREYDDFEPF
jgi:GTP-binding protein